VPHFEKNYVGKLQDPKILNDVYMVLYKKKISFIFDQTNSMAGTGILVSDWSMYKNNRL
jgi:hypothetical protein